MAVETIQLFQLDARGDGALGLLDLMRARRHGMGQPRPQAQFQPVRDFSIIDTGIDPRNFIETDAFEAGIARDARKENLESAADRLQRPEGKSLIAAGQDKSVRGEKETLDGIQMGEGPVLFLRDGAQGLPKLRGARPGMGEEDLRR